MSADARLTDSTRAIMRCPTCKGALRWASDRVDCAEAACEGSYPVVDGIPVLLDEAASVFSFSDFTSRRATFFEEPSDSILRKVVRRIVPSTSNNVRGNENYLKLRDTLLALAERPRVLVLGGSILGEGMEILADHPAIDLVESDVSLGDRTAVICDAHDIPFADGSFDGVVVQAVLEHVVDPHRCADEIHRVLGPGGVVYAETPFIQQVHGGRYDFTRFTDLGHRRLFRRFDEIESGAVCGPGMALSWSWEYFLLSFTTSRKLRAVLRIVARVTSFYLKYFDRLLIDRPGTLDAASAYYFIGRRSDTVLSDRDLIRMYRGAQ